jgi:L-alanine-DL-glutamate epimerase-like enolase superfamily enzyme
MERTGVDVIQPDVTRAGGISECVRIAQLADLRGVAMVPHSWSTGIIKAASLHVIGAMPNATFLEYCVQETALNQLLTVERFPVVDGMVALPDRPGLGVEIDEDVVQRYAVSEYVGAR